MYEVFDTIELKKPLHIPHVCDLDAGSVELLILEEDKTWTGAVRQNGEITHLCIDHVLREDAMEDVREWMKEGE